MYENQKFFNLKQASNIIGIRVRTLREWIRNGKIKAQKHATSCRWYIEKDEILKAIGREEL